MLINTLSLGIRTSNETTPVTAMGCRQCLTLSVVQLKGKHCRKLHCRNGVVDIFGPGLAGPESNNRVLGTMMSLNLYQEDTISICKCLTLQN